MGGPIRLNWDAIEPVGSAITGKLSPSRWASATVELLCRSNTATGMIPTLSRESRSLSSVRSSGSLGTNTSNTLPCSRISWSLSHSPDSAWYEKSGAASPGSTIAAEGSAIVIQVRS